MGHMDFKRLVDRIGVKQNVLAAWMGVSARTLRYWLSGDINAPKAAVVILEVLELHKASVRRQASGESE
jgi:DNA-binding transcriptional regulator YiaG